VALDFEIVSLAQGPAQAGFDATQPAYFSWLGVTMYLDEAAAIDTLRFIASCASGSEVVFEYVVSLDQLPAMMRNAMQQMASLLAARGEPWKCFFDSDALSAQLQQLGFASQHLWTPEALNQRFLTGRSDGLHIGAGPGRLMQARV
jgi:methyltransferase (TIGR00027 family)